MTTSDIVLFLPYAMNKNHINDDIYYQKIFDFSTTVVSIVVRMLDCQSEIHVLILGVVNKLSSFYIYEISFMFIIFKHNICELGKVTSN